MYLFSIECRNSDVMLRNFLTGGEKYSYVIYYKINFNPIEIARILQSVITYAINGMEN